ncbi:MAG: PEGA domain-containing protein [Thermococcus sp.]|uniref:PEGA domain-containing protein n=1 Tax=Thermococcus sp. TaxID=35749 RepID=UPI001DDFE28B|nr:PEGA domain-containing protein [Thermococcus sp.]MBO8174665.1 PEGA domain-containing protein [Thermococcus sp.]
MRKIVLFVLVFLLLLSDMVNGVYLQVKHYDLHGDICSIAIFENYFIPVGCIEGRWDEFRVLYIFNGSGVVKKIPVKDCQGECDLFTIDIVNNSLVIFYLTEPCFSVSLSKIGINLTKNYTLPEDVRVGHWGSSRIITKPREEAYGVVEVVRQNGIVETLRFEQPVGAAVILSDGTLVVGTKGYTYFASDQPIDNAGPFDVVGGHLYIYKDFPGGYLNISSNIGADIIVDEVNKGITPAFISVPLGKHRVIVRAFNQQQEFIIFVKENQTHTIEAIFKTGYLRVAGTIPWSSVKIDGVKISRTPIEVELPVGNHSVTVSFGSWSGDWKSLVYHVAVYENKTSVITPHHWLRNSTYGYIEVDFPRGATVLVDDYVYSYTPLQIPLPIGNHTVLISLDNKTEEQSHN